MKKFSILLCFVIITLIGVCGCQMEKKDNASYEQEAIAGMKEHLRQKYDSITYEVEGFVAAGWDHEHDQLNLSIVIEGEKEPFQVERHKEGNGYRYEDNLFGLLIRDEFEKKIAEYANKYFKECKVFAEMKENNYPNILGGQATLDDMIEYKEELGNITFLVVVDETFESSEAFTKAAEQFVNDWSTEEIYSTPRVIYLTHSVYETTKRNNTREILVNNRITEYSKTIK